MAQQGQGGYDGGPFGYDIGPFAAGGMQQSTMPRDFAPHHVLDANDESLMDTFFRNPDDPRVSIGGMQHAADQNFTFGMDSKDEHGQFGHEFNLDGANLTIDPASTFAESMNSNYQTHSGNHQVQPQSHVSGYVQSPTDGHANVDNDDMNGASSLLHMRGSQGMEHASQDAASWGTMGFNLFPNPAVAEHPGSRMTSRSSSDSHLGQGIPQWLYQQHLDQSRAGAFSRQAVLQQGRHPSLQLDTASNHMFSQQVPHSAFVNGHVHTGFPPVPRFGGDPNFRGGPFGYNNEHYNSMVIDKAGNLSQVPLAAQAAMSGPPRHMNHDQRTFHVTHTPNTTTRADQNTFSSPGGIGGLPMTPNSLANMKRVPQWGATNNRITNADDGEDEDESQPRKRRKSQADRDDDDEYRPEPRTQGSIPKRGPKVPKAEFGSDDEDYEYATTKQTPSTKRRRSSILPGNSASPASPADGSSRKRALAKGRQNLSEEQKRANHILSEQKRRNVIKQGYADLDQLVPILKGGKSGLSRSEQIKETVKFLESIVSGNDDMARRLGCAPDEFADLEQGSFGGY